LSILEAIAASAGRRNLSFLLVGGHAVIAHGYSRATFDIDLIIRRLDQDVWKEVLCEQHYSLEREGPTFVQFHHLERQTPPLDLMLANEETFAKLWSQAISSPAGGGGARVPSLLHLLALKCHAIKYGHPGRIVKDADDVIRLIQVNRLDVNSPELREIFLKHATPEFYEKIQRICR